MVKSRTKIKGMGMLTIAAIIIFVNDDGIAWKLFHVEMGYKQNGLLDDQYIIDWIRTMVPMFRFKKPPDTCDFCGEKNVILSQKIDQHWNS